MTAQWLDISPVLGADLPTWPGSPGIASHLRASIGAGDDANVTQLTMDVHTGLHVDAPRHFVADAGTIEDMGLAPLVGPAFVADVGAMRAITARALAGANIPEGVERLLLRTSNSRRETAYGRPFDPSYAALTPDGAEWIIARGLRLVGIDYLSIQLYEDPPDVHVALLRAEIAILEGLELTHVSPGWYELVCLPLRLVDAEAAPARAILRHHEE